MAPAFARRFITVPAVLAGVAVAYLLSLSAAAAKQRPNLIPPETNVVALQ